MGKKNLNPADAHRRAMRQKEKLKNRENRTKAREVSTLKKDTNSMEADIRRLEEEAKNGPWDKTKQSKLSELKAEVERVKKTKSEYVAAHPEHRALVYGKESAQKDGESSKGSKPGKGPLGKNGLLRHPERSIYYDPVMNPYGAPPPGMPYIERPPLPHEIEADGLAMGGEVNELENKPSGSVSSGTDDDEVDSEEDVPLPPGPPPGVEGDSEEDASDSDDSDDIPMPPGPPPRKSAASVQSTSVPLPPSAIPPQTFPPFPPQFSFPPPPPLMYPLAMPPGGFPPPPPGMPLMQGVNGIPPPPPPLPAGFGFTPPQRQQNPHYDPLQPKPHQPFQSRGLPQPPTGMKHPLPSSPVVNVSAHALAKSGGGTLSGGVSLGRSTVVTVPSASNTIPLTSSATISAAPELRDFKKESTAFVPAAVKRKKVSSPHAGNKPKKLKVNAAPAAAEGGPSIPSLPKPDLMSTLKNNLGSIVQTPTVPTVKPDDYDAFLKGIGDIL